VRGVLGLIVVCGLACSGTGDAGEDEGRLEENGADGADAGALADDDGAQGDIDAGTVAATCASEPLDALTGTARVRYSGSGGYSETSAAVVWHLVETIGCVDRYEPSGTATPDWAGGFCVTDACAPADAAIAAADGSLTIDRAVAPATYLARGETRWTATTTCQLGDGTVEESEGEVGGVWLKDAAGAVEDGGFAGLEDSGSTLVEWSFATAP
jgi:hypothetical protein